MAAYSTEQLVAWDRQYLWHPFTPMKPWIENKDVVVIERGENEFLIDTKGRRYIDGTSSIWCNVHGHHVPELDAAVTEQLGKIAHSSLLGLANVPSVLLARRLVELVQSGGINLARVFYSDDGSTAVEVACKMAYQYHANRGDTARSRFLALSSAYHGDTVGAVSLGGIALFHAAFKRLCFAVDLVDGPDLYRGAPPEADMLPPEPRAAAVLGAFVRRVDAQLAAHPGEYAAIVIEPMIQGAGGMIMHPPGTMEALREIADRHGALLVFDEVMTGFGRTGKMFACEHEGVTPDLLCLSKGLTAGYMPLGVTLTTERVFDAFYADPREGKTFFHGHTFTGHPLACAVALRSLELFAEHRLLDHVRALEPLLDEILLPLRGKPYVGDVRRRGLVAAVELVQDKPTRASFPYHWRIGGALCTRMREHGLMMRPLADVIVIMPPLAITTENLRHLCTVVAKSVDWIPETIAEKKREFGE